MSNPSFQTGETYTLDELASLARHGLDTFQGGITQVEAADYLNKHHGGIRGQYSQAQISGALKNPGRNPAMIRLLVEAFTDYRLDEKPRFLLHQADAFFNESRAPDAPREKRGTTDD